MTATAAAALLALVGGCSAGGEEEELTVLAAASLTETFEELARTFEAEHPGVQVRLVLDASSTLAEQVRQGAPGDVLATADERTMDAVTAAGETASTPEAFATNRLVLAVPADDEAAVQELADLDRPGTRLVVCVPAAPCGRVARELLVELDVGTAPVSEEVDVKAVLHKVELGEADAGLVYATDVLAAGGKVRAVELKGATEAATTYAIAPLARAEQPELAREWLDLVLSTTGRGVLADAGFGPP